MPPTRPLPAPPPALPAPHPLPLVWVHWATAGCIVLAFGAVLLREAIDADAPRALLLALHRQAGLGALMLTLLRVVLRALQRRTATAAPDGARWARRAATLVHLALYGVLIAVPLLGWLLSGSRGQHPSVGGALPLPTLAPTDPDAADLYEDRHALLAWTLGALATLHIAAALWHHWVLRDGLLHAMAPARRRTRSRTPSRPQEPSAR